MNGELLRNHISKNQLTKSRQSDAGLDIVASQMASIPAKGSVKVSTDLYIAIPTGHVGLVWSRSGLSFKKDIEVGAGCIDSGYRGEVKVHLYNHGNIDQQIYEGDAIAQLLTIPVNLQNYEEVDELGETDRGDKGFGSSDRT